MQDRQTDRHINTTWQFLIQLFQKKMPLGWVIMEIKKKQTTTNILTKKLHHNPMLITRKPFSLIHIFATFNAVRDSAWGEGGLDFSTLVRLLHSEIIYYSTEFSTLTVHCFWNNDQEKSYCFHVQYLSSVNSCNGIQILEIFFLFFIFSNGSSLQKITQ